MGRRSTNSPNRAWALGPLADPCMRIWIPPFTPTRLKHCWSIAPDGPIKLFSWNSCLDDTTLASIMNAEITSQGFWDLAEAKQEANGLANGDLRQCSVCGE